MKRLLLCAMIVATAPFPTPANAEPADGPSGRKCAFNSATDVTREAGWQTGQLNGGPMVTAVSDLNGIMRCRVVVNGGGVHAAGSVVDVSAFAVAGVAAVPVTPINYPATAADDIYLCTSWEPASGPTLYWVGDAVPGLGHWDTSPDTICSVPFTIEPNDPECSIWKYVDSKLGTNIAEVWQDCEPYPTFDPCAALGNPPVVCPLPVAKPSRPE